MQTGALIKPLENSPGPYVRFVLWPLQYYWPPFSAPNLAWPCLESPRTSLVGPKFLGNAHFRTDH